MPTATLVQTTWIHVSVTDGMFSNEKAVTIKLSDGKEISLFASNSILKKEESKWLLRVTEIGRNGKTMKILLPSEAFVTSSRWAIVSI